MDLSRKQVFGLIGASVVVIGIVAVAFALSPTSTKGSVSLPTGCRKPVDGYLIVASDRGYNDSVDHLTPGVAWPQINVTLGQTVNIVVCNTDSQAHGFQILHYFDSRITALMQGQVMTVSFVATVAGHYLIFCAIICSLHVFMQAGDLYVRG